MVEFGFYYPREMQSICLGSGESHTGDFQYYIGRYGPDDQIASAIAKIPVPKEPQQAKYQMKVKSVALEQSLLVLENLLNLLYNL